MLRVAIMLEYDIIDFVLVPRETLNQLVAQNTAVELCIQAVVDLGQKTRSFGRHAAPNHQRPAAMLDRLGHMLRLTSGTGLLPAPLAPIGTEAVNLGFIGPY